MAYFHTTVLDENIKALPTVDTASGSVASFDTDMTEKLIEVVCDIQYSQASGTPTPSDPLPITVYNSLNLSHSGADTSNPNVTNIPFGQTVAKGTLNVITGVLEITHGAITDLSSLNWLYSGGAQTFNVVVSGLATGQPCVCSVYDYSPVSIGPSRPDLTIGTSSYFGEHRLNIKDTNYDGSTINDFKTSLSGQTCVYELATPTTIQLSATQITALLNENNIWCDTGDTSVKYLLTVGKAIS